MANPLDAYDPIFQAAGTAWNVDPMLLKAIGMQECPTGNPRCVSPAGAQGLMQIMPPTQKYLGVEKPFDAVESIWGAAKYMDEALTKEGSPEAALLYYHGGPGWRQTYSKNTESQTYVPAVVGHYKTLQAAQPPSSSPPSPTP